MRQKGNQDFLPVARGVLRPEEAQKAFRLQLFPAHPELRPWVEYYWSVSWDLGDQSFDQTVVTNPTIDLSFEEDEGTNGPGRHLVVTGVAPRSYRRHLTGKGDVIAVHFLPGQFRSWWQKGVQSLTGRALNLGSGTRPWEAPAAALLPHLLDQSPEERVLILDDFLLGYRPAADPVANEIQRLVAASRDDRDLWSPLVMANLRAVSPRTNQRQFLEYVGVGPKWVLMRHRIQAALLALDAARTAGVVPDLTDLALDLGWYDQAHFSREFKNLVGVSPDSYRRT